MSRRRRLILFLRYAEPGMDVALLGLSSFFFLFQLPLDVFMSPFPATGGDMGSHFWPLLTLVDHGLPHATIKLWSPGNLGGEPHFVHYFPFPFLVMALLSKLVPIGTAFNIGSLLGLFFLPASAYACVRGLGYRFPGPILAAAAVHCFLYNESYTMWGGNTLSTLAGQFAHGYALCLLLLGVGALGWEIRRRAFPFVSSLCFTALALSHAYVLMGVPVIALSVILFFPFQSTYQRFWHLTRCGIYSGLMSVWFLIPMIDNARWNTPFYFKWISKDLLSEVFPQIYNPVLLLLAIALPLHVLFYLSTTGRSRRTLSAVPFWLLPALFYVGLYFIFPRLGLVDIRAFPQTELFVCLLGAILFSELLRHSGRLFTWVSVFPLFVLALYWTDTNTVQLDHWLEWNYSGWRTKRLYPELKELSETIRGDLSDPRVIYEHNDTNNATGTIRVFEMLPYFANRATLESVYLQASLLSPYAFHFQALISKTPSCPFQQFPCPKYIRSASELELLRPKLELMGVGGLILTTEEIVKVFEDSPDYRSQGSFAHWNVYEAVNQPALVEVVEKPLGVVAESDYKQSFFDWFQDYTGEQALLLAIDPKKPSPLARLQAGIVEGHCDPTLELDVNLVRLKTPCPGRLHYLKIGYHHTWRASTGDPLYLVSPGFVALIPSEEVVTLSFGQSPLWQGTFIVSGLTWVAFLFSFLRYRDE